MARGIRATLRQRIAGRKNVVKAQISRIGLRQQRYRRRVRW